MCDEASTPDNRSELVRYVPRSWAGLRGLEPQRSLRAIRSVVGKSSPFAILSSASLQFFRSSCRAAASKRSVGLLRESGRRGKESSSCVWEAGRVQDSLHRRGGAL